MKQTRGQKVLNNKNIIVGNNKNKPLKQIYKQVKYYKTQKLIGQKLPAGKINNSSQNMQTQFRDKTENEHYGLTTESQNKSIASYQNLTNNAMFTFNNFYKIKQKSTNNAKISFGQNLLFSHPTSPENKIYKNLKLFRFDQKIEQIQSQEVQKLIQKQILMQQLNNKDQQQWRSNNNAKNKNNVQLSKLKKNYRYFLKNSIKTPSNLHERHKNLFNSKLFTKKNKSQCKRRNQNEENEIKKSLAMTQSNFNYRSYQNGKQFTPNKSLLTFYNKQLNPSQKNQKSQNSLNNLSQVRKFSNCLHKQASVNDSNKIDLFKFNNPPQSIQQKLLKLSKKSFSLTKNYQKCINNQKYSQINPQLKKQLMFELNISKDIQQKLLSNKSYSNSVFKKRNSGYQNIKKKLDEKYFFVNKDKKDGLLSQDVSLEKYENARYNFNRFYREKQKLDNQFLNQQLNYLKSYKIDYEKPMKLKIRMKSNNRNFFNQKVMLNELPLLKRSRNNESSLNSSNNQILYDEDSQSMEDVLTSHENMKFQQMYVNKIEEEQIQKLIKQKNCISRQSVSPLHHELSAWSFGGDNNIN